jgi:hypothetical protein
VSSLQLPGKVWIGSAPVDPIRRLGTGVPALDDLLDGGFPRGRLSEIVGAPSSGRTSLACALLAEATRQGEAAAVIDLPDALHPEALWRAGAHLDRVLWVRPPSLPAAFKCTELVLIAGGFGLVVLDLGLQRIHSLPPAVWPRLQRAAKRADTALIVLAPQRVAGSFSTLSLALTLQRARWGSGAWQMLEGFKVHMTLGRNRIGRFGSSAECWVLSAEKGE